MIWRKMALSESGAVESFNICVSVSLSSPSMQ